MSSGDSAALVAGAALGPALGGVAAAVVGAELEELVEVGVGKVDVVDALAACGASSSPPNSAMPASANATANTTTATPIAAAMRRRRCCISRRAARGEVMRRHGSH